MVRQFAGWAMVLVLLALQGQAPVASAPAEKFQLAVKFHNGGAEFVEEVTINQPFGSKIVKVQNGSFGISGVVLPPVDGQYPVVLSYFSWWSEALNNNGIVYGKFTLGEKQSGGANGAGHDITLTRLEPKKP